MVLELLSTAHAARTLVALELLGNQARFTPLRDAAGIGDQQLTRALKHLNASGYVSGRVTGVGERAPMHYHLTRLGAEALGILRMWHDSVHGTDTPAARAADQELEALVMA